MKIVECVPNFSEGRNRETIDAIAREISSTSGVKLLDVDPGHDANRTVMTFAGEAGAVGEAAFKAIATAARLIDMRSHAGTHPRMGATDVCPFVPVSGITMEECVELSRAVAKRVGDALRIPVYLYEASALDDFRRRLDDIRRGEYEGLKAKMHERKWRPDFGPAVFNEKSGATVIGARAFLIAYNVNLNTTSVAKARAIAAQVREKKDGGGLKACRAIGWDMPSYGCVQVSMNLVDYTVTPVHVAFEEVRRLARESGLRVTGSELVGLIPMEAMLAAGRFYLEKQGRSPGLPYDEVIRCAVRSLGLGDVAPFDPESKILEKKLFPRPLGGTAAACFVDSLSSDSPSPGGGSAAAFSGSMGAGLLAMVAGIAYRKQKDPAARQKLAVAALEAQKLKEKLLDLSLRDEAAYNEAVSAHALPSKTDAERAARGEEIARALGRCIDVPVEVMQACLGALELFKPIIGFCPAAVASDFAGALNCLRGCAYTAGAVVLINLRESALLPADYVEKVKAELKRTGEAVDELCGLLDAELGKMLIA